MPTKWYFKKDGVQKGPVHSETLKHLAEYGELKPDDLVWKHGSKERQQAGRISGLFAASIAEKPPSPPPTSSSEPPKENCADLRAAESNVPSSEQPTSTPEPVEPKIDNQASPDQSDKGNSLPPSPLPPTDNSGSGPEEQSDLGKAAKDFWIAARAKGKEVGGQLLEATKDLGGQAAEVARGRGTQSDGKAGDNSVTATRPPISKRTLLTVGGGLLAFALMCGVCGMCGGIVNLISGDAGSGGRSPVSSKGNRATEGFLSSFDDIPPPVQKAVQGGMEVWELKGFHPIDGSQRPQGSVSMYVAVSVDALHLVVVKNVLDALMAEMRKAKKGEVSWSVMELTYSGSERPIAVDIKWDWKMSREGENIKLRFEQISDTTKIPDSNPMIITKRCNLTINVDRELNQGFWKSEVSETTDYRGSVGYVPDKTEKETGHGPAYLVQ